MLIPYDASSYYDYNKSIDFLYKNGVSWHFDLKQSWCGLRREKKRNFRNSLICASLTRWTKWGRVFIIATLSSTIFQWKFIENFSFHFPLHNDFSRPTYQWKSAKIDVDWSLTGLIWHLDAAKRHLISKTAWRNINFDFIFSISLPRDTDENLEFLSTIMYECKSVHDRVACMGKTRVSRCDADVIKKCSSN